MDYLMAPEAYILACTFKVPTLCVQAEKALARLHLCAGSSKPWLLTYAKNTNILSLGFLLDVFQ